MDVGSVESAVEVHNPGQWLSEEIRGLTFITKHCEHESLGSEDVENVAHH